MIPESIQVAFQVVEIFENLELSYLIGGSIASSVYGEPRATQDIDIVVGLNEHQIQSLLAAAKDDFYIDEEDIRQAISRQSSFNVVHLATLTKVDIFILGSDPMDLEELRRRQRSPLTPDSDQQVYLATPEDVILQKLDWYRKGGEVSDRQWRDILGVLKVQAHSLDWNYLRHWAEHLNLSEYLHKAGVESGLNIEDDNG